MRFARGFRAWSRSRVGAAVAGTAAAVLLAACGNAPDANVAANSSEGDLFAQLPSTTAPPTTETTAPPTTTSAPASTTSKAAAAGTRADRPAASRGSGSDGPGHGWRKVAGDEFNGASLDQSVWTAYNSKGGFGNGYRKPEAVSLGDGVLRITARGDVSGGIRHNFGQTYGRWEFRARTDPGRGFGSAILLWPDSEKWPDDGEIDIMEVPGENRDVAHFVLHMGPENRLHGTNIRGTFSRWHTFAVEWLPDRITWYVDGVKRYENTDKKMIPTKPMHLTIQLDQGPYKNWIPAPDETTPPELSLEVDWVRVYAPA